MAPPRGLEPLPRRLEGGRASDYATAAYWLAASHISLHVVPGRDRVLASLRDRAAARIVEERRYEQLAHRADRQQWNREQDLSLHCIASLYDSNVY